MILVIELNTRPAKHKQIDENLDIMDKKEMEDSWTGLLQNQDSQVIFTLSTHRISIFFFLSTQAKHSLFNVLFTDMN